MKKNKKTNNAGADERNICCDMKTYIFPFCNSLNYLSLPGVFVVDSVMMSKALTKLEKNRRKNSSPISKQKRIQIQKRPNSEHENLRISLTCAKNPVLSFIAKFEKEVILQKKVQFQRQRTNLR